MSTTGYNRIRIQSESKRADPGDTGVQASRGLVRGSVRGRANISKRAATLHPVRSGKPKECKPLDDN